MKKNEYMVYMSHFLKIKILTMFIIYQIFIEYLLFQDLY